jgi:V-type H+-transporting ATPase subunit a
MKLAIIIGFMQMSLGLICFGLNSLYFKDYVSLLISFPCKVLFFVLTIGYMVYLIIAKWLTSWPNSAVAPSVISTMVDMWMHQGKVVLPMADDIPA